HRLYYAKGFVRRPERETFFASAYDERLLALSYRIPDPLPPGQVIRVERKEPAFTLPFGPHTAVRIRPERPAGVPDGCGAFVIDRTIPDAVLTRAERVAQKLSGCASAPEREGKDGIGSTAVLRRQLLNDVWAGAYAALWSEDPDASTAAAQVFYARLDVLERRLAATGSFLAGSRPGEEDALLFSLLLAYDLNWRPGFGQSAPAVADWPHLWRFAKKLLVSARLSNGELCDAGLSPRPDGSFAEPYGPIPAIEGIGDPRTEWLQASDALRTRLPPRDPGVPNTPYSDDLPPAPPDDRQRVARLAERVSVFERRLSGNDAEADAVGDVRTDLVASLQTLAEGARAADQIAVRRLFFARLGWFEARLAKTVFLNGDQAGGADHALAEVLSEYAAGLDRILTPIDPVLDDFPGLAALYSRLSAKRQGAANRSHGPPRGRARKTVKPKQTK
ncbi:MAG: hypothetical protein LBO81_01920, partial [Clostridiales Family XIII bacterium]|nr:hypothetical protein [Clostridiales Family XIII bacterium]